MGISAKEAAGDLSSLVRRVIEEQVPIEISAEAGDAVLLSLADYEALQEMALYLKVPDTADLLITALEEARGLESHASDRT